MPKPRKTKEPLPILVPFPLEHIVSVTYEGKVFPLARPRFAGGHAYQPLGNQQDLRDYLYNVRPDKPFDCDLWIDCYFYYSDKRLADCDNLLKAVGDALQAAQWITNDRKIVGGLYFRGKAPFPHAFISISEAGWHEA